MASFDKPVVDFLQSPVPIVVGTTRMDGTVVLNPAWFEYVDGVFLLNTRPESRWLRRIQHRGRATLLLIDPAQPSRVFQAWTDLVSVEDDDGSHLRRLAHRYLGREFPGPPHARVTVGLAPTRFSESVTTRPVET